MQKIVINTGSGFDLTYKAVLRYAELKGLKLTTYSWDYHDSRRVWRKTNNDDQKFISYFNNVDSEILYDVRENWDKKFHVSYIGRTDPALIQAVKELQESEHLELKIVEVPDDVKWKIETDEMGPECVREVSRCWK